MTKTNTTLRRAAVLALSLLLAVTFLAPGAYAAKKLTVKPTKVTLKVGGKKKLTANQKAKWSVSKKDAKIVKLSKKSGKATVVTAKKAGKAVVRAKAGKSVKKITVNVKAAQPAALKAEQKFASVLNGKTIQLKVNRTDVTWTSADPTIATVSSKGVVTGVAKDKGTTITAATKDGKQSVKIDVRSGMNGISAAKTNEINNNGYTQNGYKVLDVRDAAKYAKAHIPASVNTDMVNNQDAASQKKAVETAVKGDDPATKYILACNSGNSLAQKAHDALIALGVSEDRILNLAGGYLNEDLIVNNYISASDFKAAPAGYQVIDCRKAADFAKNSIEGAVNADMYAAVSSSNPLEKTAAANMKNAISGKAKDTKYVLLCYSGNRYANAGAANLRALGVSNDQIFVLTGGAKAYEL